LRFIVCLFAVYRLFVCGLSFQYNSRREGFGDWRGFARTEWKLFEKETPRRVKPLPYIFRVLPTGIHLLRAGEIEANPSSLNEIYRLPYIPELIERKVKGAEKGVLPGADLNFYRKEYERLVIQPENVSEQTSLPENASARDELNDLPVRIGLKGNSRERPEGIRRKSAANKKK